MENDNYLWFLFEDIFKIFKSMSITRIQNWYEIRLKGKFIRIEEEIDHIISKYY